MRSNTQTRPIHPPACFIIIAVVVSVTSGIRADEPVAPSVAIEAVKRHGGFVRQFNGPTGELEIEFHVRGRKLNDRSIQCIAALPNTVALNLRDTKITGAGLVHLRGLEQLQSLHLERTRVDDTGIAHLVTLKNLEYLNLYGTKVTDKSLKHLSKLKNLKRLYVWKTGITKEGATWLKRMIPGVRVIRGTDTTAIAVQDPEEEREKEPTVVLEWKPISIVGEVPKSENGINSKIVFENNRKQTVKLYWVDYGGKLKLYGQLDPGQKRIQNTYAKNSWLVTDENDMPLGYFIAGPDVSRAVIPTS